MRRHTLLHTLLCKYVMLIKGIVFPTHLFSSPQLVMDHLNDDIASETGLFFPPSPPFLARFYLLFVPATLRPLERPPLRTQAETPWPFRLPPGDHDSQKRCAELSSASWVRVTGAHHRVGIRHCWDHQ